LADSIIKNWPGKGRVKLDVPLGHTAPDKTTRRSTHDTEKTKTQSLVGI
jgi:hypothetical protein